MKTDANAWYVRWFAWNCSVLDQMFPLNHPRTDRYEDRTNLCHFFRTILLGSIAAFLSLAMYAYAALVILVLPFVLFTASGVGIVVGVALLLVATMTLALYLIFGVAPKMATWTSERVQIAFQVSTEPNPGFFQLVWRYIVGVKKKFCPTIQFTQNGKD